MRSLLVLAVFLAGCTLPDLAAHEPVIVDPTFPPLPWTLSFVECKEYFLNLVVDAAGARAVVPTNFTILGGAQGRATVAIGVAKCKKTGLQGNESENVSLSDAGVMIQPPDGAPGIHAYQLWSHTDVREQRAAMRTLGIPSDLGEFTLDQGALTPLAPAKATAGANASNYTITGATLAPRAPINFEISWWRATNNGTIRIHYVFTGTSAEARGTVTAPTGSPVAKLLGTTSAEGGGFLPQFGGTGRVERVTLGGTH